MINFKFWFILLLKYRLHSVFLHLPKLVHYIQYRIYDHQNNGQISPTLILDNRLFLSFEIKKDLIYFKVTHYQKL